MFIGGCDLYSWQLAGYLSLSSSELFFDPNLELSEAEQVSWRDFFFDQVDTNWIDDSSGHLVKFHNDWHVQLGTGIGRQQVAFEDLTCLYFITCRCFVFVLNAPTTFG